MRVHAAFKCYKELKVKSRKVSHVLVSLVAVPSGEKKSSAEREEIKNARHEVRRQCGVLHESNRT